MQCTCNPYAFGIPPGDINIVQQKHKTEEDYAFLLHEIQKSMLHECGTVSDECIKLNQFFKAVLCLRDHLLDKLGKYKPPTPMQ